MQKYDNVHHHHHHLYKHQQQHWNWKRFDKGSYWLMLYYVWVFLEGDVQNTSRWIAKAERGVHTFYLKAEEMQRNDMLGEKWGYN